MKCISGIDSLYFFLESGERYPELFFNIAYDLQQEKNRFEYNDMEFHPHDLKIQINGESFHHLGRAEGFYWFRQKEKLFRVGFKDPQTNTGLHNIRG